MDPYYVQMQLPEKQPRIRLAASIRPRSSDDSRQQLEAFMVAQTDEQGQSRIVAYTVPGLKVDGPVIANRSMLADPEVAETTTLLGQRGSGVKLGNMLLVPLDGGDNEDALLYLRPLYEASGSQPAVQQVIAAYGESVRICSTVELVLGALLLLENQVGDNCENVTPVSLSGSLRRQPHSRRPNLLHSLKLLTNRAMKTLQKPNNLKKPPQPTRSNSFSRKLNKLPRRK